MDYSRIKSPYNFKSDDGLSYPPKSYMDEVAELASVEDTKKLRKTLDMFNVLFQ